MYILSLSNSHNNAASIQKNRGDKSHRVIVASLDPTLVISIVFALIFQKDSKVCILKLVVLVKFAFVMQRLKKYLKEFCRDQQRWGGGHFLHFMGGHSCYEGGHRAHGGPPSPPAGENPGVYGIVKYKTLERNILNTPNYSFQKMHTFTPSLLWFQNHSLLQHGLLRAWNSDDKLRA